ncbi:hypothetical protein ACA910_000828 [Epithemia clementina (nom. ined.)]
MEADAPHDEAAGRNDKAITSPAAKAFFAALDGNASDNVVSGRRPHQSDFVNKKIRTLGWRNRHSQDEFYPVTLIKQPIPRVGVQFSVRQVQRGELEGKYGTGATVWPASMVLVKYLERHAHKLVQGKRVADLGAGTGVTSIAAAYFGAQEVVCTDGEPNVVRLARDNIAKVADNAQQEQDKSANAEPQHSLAGSSAYTDDETATAVETFAIHGVNVHVQQYWWGSGTLIGGNGFDLVIVSDCVLPKLYPIAPLVDALDDLLRPKTDGIHDEEALAVISYEHRHFPDYDPRDKFRELAKAKSLVVENVPMEEQDEIYSVDDIEIWLVRRQAKKTQA